jgi:hypothetical protein
LVPPSTRTSTNTISVPFGGGNATVGEQAIRSGTNLEINFTGSPTSRFNFRWGVAGNAIALRRTFTGVPAGWAEVEWTADPMSGFFAYASQDGGATWQMIYSGLSFEVIATDLDVIFVGNDGADSSGGENGGLQAVTVTYPAEPAPSPTSKPTPPTATTP